MTQIVKVVYSCSALGNVSPVLSAYGCIDSWVLHLSPKLLADALKVRIFFNLFDFYVNVFVWHLPYVFIVCISKHKSVDLKCIQLILIID